MYFELRNVKGLLERLVESDGRLAALAETEFELPIATEEGLDAVEMSLEDSSKITKLVRIVNVERC